MRRLAFLALVALVACSSPRPPTPAPPCPGDCNSDGVVSAAELALCKELFLDETRVSECPACDVDGNGEVAINELQAAANSHTLGCPR